MSDVSAVIHRWFRGGQPYLVLATDAPQVKYELQAAGASVLEFEISPASPEPWDVYTAFWSGMRSVMPFPEWCGNGWDSFGDAWDEISAELRFPVVVLIHRYAENLSSNEHQALHDLMYFTRHCDYSWREGDEMHVIFAGGHWNQKEFRI